MRSITAVGGGRVDLVPSYVDTCFGEAFFQSYWLHTASTAVGKDRGPVEEEEVTDACNFLVLSRTGRKQDLLSPITLVMDNSITVGTSEIVNAKLSKITLRCKIILRGSCAKNLYTILLQSEENFSDSSSHYSHLYGIGHHRGIIVDPSRGADCADFHVYSPCYSNMNGRSHLTRIDFGHTQRDAGRQVAVRHGLGC